MAFAALLTACSAASNAPRHPSATTPHAYQDDVFYEIFVRSYRDSDGDGIGDLAGVTASLDSLQELGVTGLWLTPIHPSPSYHGYDVTDYRAVHPELGTRADLERLVAEAHRRGIRVILDFVLNHTSIAHPWFASRPDFYVWRTERPEGWRRPWDDAPVWHRGARGYYYGIFWSGMPDLDLTNPAVEDAMVEAMNDWLALGVDGFRIDAARYLAERSDGANADLPETHALVRRIRSRLDGDALLVAEAWTDLEIVARYQGSFDLAFDFSMAGAILTSANDGNGASLKQVLARAEAALEDRSFLAPFLTNHDMRRAMRVLGGDEGKARVAAATLFAMPGTPFVYYGEEIGMQGADEARDEAKRTPFRWSDGPGFGFTTGTPWFEDDEAPGVNVEAQRADPDALREHYRRLIALRKQSVPLRRGATSRPAIEGGGRGAFALLREAEEERMLYVVNLWSEPTEPFEVHVRGEPVVRFADCPIEVRSTGDALTIALAPRCAAFIALQSIRD